MQFELPLAPGRPEPADDRWLTAGARRVRLHFVRNRRARRYILRLRPDGNARVTIPRGGSVAEAARFAKRNTAWLEKQLLRRELQPIRARTWFLGTEILWRGEWVRLEAVQDAPDVIQFGGERTRLAKSPASEPGASAPGFDAMDLRPAVEGRLREIAARELPGRVLELAAEHQFPVRRVVVRNQRSRWGSCSRSGTVSLNWRLIQAPILVRDYIILHELAHLKVMNHSRRFWTEVARLCPEFDQAERWLKAHAGLLS